MMASNLLVARSAQGVSTSRKRRTAKGSSSSSTAMAVYEAQMIDARPVPAIPVPLSRRARANGITEPPNLSTQMDAERIQEALRTAERGDTWQLFAIYRDMLLNYAHFQSEWIKRKAVISGQPEALIPKDQKNADDVLAAEVIRQMIDNCECWSDSVDHLLDGTLYPVAVAEKIYRPVQLYENDLKIPVRFLLKQVVPVNYSLLCFRLPYTPSATGTALMARGASMIRGGSGYSAVNPATVYDVDSWEPDLRFYETLESGSIDYSLERIYSPERERHIVHRGNMLSRSIRDNFGGQMRAILFWWLLATKGRDWFAVYMQKYGSPFLVGKTNAADKNSVDFLRDAFSMASQIGGLVIDRQGELELIQAAAQDGSNAHRTLQTVCNDEVSKIVVGQVLSSTAKNTGLGSGVANLHGEVRQDIRLYDMRRLSQTMEKQLFEPYLRMNGFRGRAPTILWGGEKEHEALTLAQAVSAFAEAGLEPTDEGLKVVSHRIGYDLQRNAKLLGGGSGMSGDGGKLKALEASVLALSAGAAQPPGQPITINVDAREREKKLRIERDEKGRMTAITE